MIGIPYSNQVKILSLNGLFHGLLLWSGFSNWGAIMIWVQPIEFHLHCIQHVFFFRNMVETMSKAGSRGSSFGDGSIISTAAI